MSREFIDKWHLGLVAWGALVGLLAATAAHILGRRAAGRVRQATETCTLVIGWTAAAWALGLMEPSWLLVVAVAALLAILGWPWPSAAQTASVSTAARDSRRQPRLAGFLERPQVFATMAMLSAWGIWAAVPDTEVPVFAASSLTIWWLISTGIAVDPAPAPEIESIGGLPAASVSLALPAALIGGAGGTSWIGALGCFATILGLWIGSWVDRWLVQRREAKARQTAVGRTDAGPLGPSDPGASASTLPSELLAALMLVGHLIAVYWASRILSQAAPSTALAGVATLFVAGLAISQLTSRLAPPPPLPDLEGSNDE